MTGKREFTYQRKFYVVLLHNAPDAKETGKYLTERTADVFWARYAHGALEQFMAKYFPDEMLWNARDEQTREDKECRLWSHWSAGTTASGQRLYVKEQIAGFGARDISRSEWRKAKCQ